MEVFLVSEYVYMCSDQPFLEKELYSFFFEKNIDEDTKDLFSFSNHFTLDKYQVASISLYLPEEKKRTLRIIDHNKALNELLSYIQYQFTNPNRKKIEVLFCLNGQENEPLTEKLVLYIEELTLEKLYYRNFKFITIYR